MALFRVRLTVGAAEGVRCCVVSWEARVINIIVRCTIDAIWCGLTVVCWVDEAAVLAGFLSLAVDGGVCKRLAMITSRDDCEGA